MKTVVVTAVIASLFSIAGVLGIQSMRGTQEPRMSSAFDSRFSELSSGIGANAGTIASLASEVNQLRDKLNRMAAPSIVEAEAIADVEPANLEERIKILEKNMGGLLTAKASLGPGRGEAVKELFADSSHVSEKMQAQSQNRFAGAESEFESDSGRYIGDHRDSISEVLHAVDAFEVKGMDCKDTICKITYSQAESLGTPEGESELVDQLTQSMDGVGVEVRYADDPYGNQVMYIKLR